MEEAYLLLGLVKFIFSEKATKIWRNLQILFEIAYQRQKKLFRHILVTFSECMNFKSFLEIIKE